ncbi:superoxide dismutase [Streptomyces scopuliridis]|uniref:Superoxide dismutase n=1 Tax=Streptomyces scopuliridis TaxID=452529 RepID=A0ACD4ZJ25_9ACTN|nr:superoxide dismutase [Streptomyces scopuliridis]WSB98194.1 superoxide dismutase [Streptomyces scopuliridis]WSC08104.1 superoxide dismutase [Streptomyces scopuliridis]
MRHSFARRSLFGAAAAIGGAALLAPLGGTAAAMETTGRRRPAGFPLPDGFRPEGIAIGSEPYAYIGSIARGDVYRASLATGSGRVVVEGLGPEHPVIGLKTDAWGRLFLCGGVSGEIRIADLRTGRITRTFTVGTDATMVNDVILTPDAAWFTDSFEPQLYKLPLGRRGEPGDRIITVPLSGDWVQGTAITANGITTTPDGRALLVVNSFANGGGLMRVAPRTGVARAVDLGPTRLPNGDGLLLLGHTLYAVQQRQNAIDVLRIDDAGTKGTAITRITDPANFRVPTTAAVYGDRIYLPNARFDVAEPTPETDYDVVSVERVRA